MKIFCHMSTFTSCVLIRFCFSRVLGIEVPFLGLYHIEYKCDIRFCFLFSLSVTISGCPGCRQTCSLDLLLLSAFYFWFLFSPAEDCEGGRESSDGPFLLFAPYSVGLNKQTNMIQCIFKRRPALTLYHVLVHLSTRNGQLSHSVFLSLGTFLREVQGAAVTVVLKHDDKMFFDW